MTPANNPNLHPLQGVPSGMDNDPNADEEIIDQTGSDQTAPYPDSNETELQPNANAVGLIPSQQTDDPAHDENLRQKIDYALSGAEPPFGDLAPRKVVTEGTTGASLDEEEDNLKNKNTF